jgi:hypothetical protein
LAGEWRRAARDRGGLRFWQGGGAVPVDLANGKQQKLVLGRTDLPRRGDAPMPWRRRARSLWSFGMWRSFSLLFLLGACVNFHSLEQKRRAELQPAEATAAAPKGGPCA